MVTIPSSAKYFADAERYLRGNYRIQLRQEIVAELIGHPRGQTILDLGCGNGAISLPLAADNDVTLVDNSAAMIAAAHDHARSLGIADYQAIQADVTTLQIEPVDLVLAIGLLAHVDNMEDVFDAIGRYLRPAGAAVVQLSDRTKMLNRLARLIFAVRGRGYEPMSTGEVIDCAKRNGFILVDQRSHLVILPGVPRLLGSALLPYDRFVRRYPMLANQGTDTLLLLRKSSR